MELLRISSCDDAPRYILTHNITHVLTLINKDRDLQAVSQVMNRRIWKTLYFRDLLTSKNVDSPTEDHCRQILEFGKTLKSDARLLVHCEAGVSRSSCAALALLAQKNGTDWISLQECKNELWDIRPVASPNMLMAKYFDKLLDCGGRFERIAKRINQDAPMLNDKIRFKD